MKTCDKHSAVDVVEGVREDPCIFGIIDLEVEIGGSVIWLDGREICAYYAGGGKLLGEFYGPDSCTSCDVEDVVEATFQGVERC